MCIGWSWALALVPGLRLDQSEYGVSLATMMGSERIMSSSQQNQWNARRLFWLLPCSEEDVSSELAKTPPGVLRMKSKRRKSEPGDRKTPVPNDYVRTPRPILVLRFLVNNARIFLFLLKFELTFLIFVSVGQAPAEANVLLTLHNKWTSGFPSSTCVWVKCSRPCCWRPSIPNTIWVTSRLRFVLMLFQNGFLSITEDDSSSLKILYSWPGLRYPGPVDGMMGNIVLSDLK